MSKNFKKILFLYLLFLLLLVLPSKVFGATIPDEVITKAREVNLYHTDNVIILQDTATSDYYIPYCESCSSNSNSWRYTTYKGVNCFICPSWHVLSCKKYSNGSFTDLGSRAMNTIGSNSVIQENFNNIALVPVFADNNINYYNVEGHTNGDVFFSNAIKPEILDTDDNLRFLNMTNLLIDTGNINIKEGYFDFLIRTKTLGSTDDFITVYHTKLNKSSSFYKTGGINGDYFEIPVNTFKNLLTKGNLISYDLMWLEEGKDISETVSRSVIFGYENTETNDILNNNFKNLFNLITKQALDEVALLQKQHEESQETQKGILATIKEVVSYINPFSENFFVYKLIDLLIEALKNLFIPGDEFFSNYFNELKEWFSDRFGFLAYPLDLVLDILNRILNINFTEPAFNIPEIKEPITNTNLISATSFNFNTLLENSTLKTVHDTYLILVDAVIIFALVNLAKLKFEEVMTK